MEMVEQCLPSLVPLYKNLYMYKENTVSLTHKYVKIIYRYETMTIRCGVFRSWF